jgi:hypothetical protein
MTPDDKPVRPLWQAALLGAIPPMLLAWATAVGVREWWISVLDKGHVFEGDGPYAARRPAEMFTGGWFVDVGTMLMWFAVAFLGVQLLLFIAMSIAERRQPQPTVAWLCAGVAATTPLVLYSVWPDASLVPTWQILIVYAVGIGAAWFTRRLRYGEWL